MELSKHKSKIETDPMRYIWMLYGEPKIGKTTIASKMPHAYFIATEPGHKFLELYKTDVGNWVELMDTCAQLVKEKETSGFKTVVFDTASNAFEMLCDHIVKEAHEDGMNEGKLSFGKGFAAAKKQFKALLVALANHGFGIVLIVHEMLKDSNFHGVERSRYLPNLSKVSRDSMVPLCDFIGRMFAGKMDKDGEMAYCRFIAFEGTPEYEAGDRTNRLAPHGKIELVSPDTCWGCVAQLFEDGDDTVVTSG